MADEINLEAVQQILGRAVTDPAFRRDLLDNPEDAIKDYDLNEQQVDFFKQLDEDAFEELARETRNIRGFFNK
ncbi:MAG: Os1348 family NHLP clan protein [Pirellulales bacterium]|jgi:hypothetical protein|nr:Os1348 family NHLP clan protein [Pirellulales bacterium]|tara:strand:- start:582 stop:800 length:219 start_codon:yes stop_codon:yes gene_type:complete